MKLHSITWSLCALLGVFAVLLAFCACNDISDIEPNDIPADAIVTLGEEEAVETYYFYGIELQDGTYYVRVLRQYEETPADGAYLYLPLAAEIEAYFQEDGTVGAWSPLQYLTVEELASGNDYGRITTGVQFTATSVGGYVIHLEEFNPYTDGDIDLTNGAPITEEP